MLSYCPGCWCHFCSEGPIILGWSLVWLGVVTSFSTATCLLSIAIFDWFGRNLSPSKLLLPSESTTFVCRGKNPYVYGLKPSCFNLLKSKGMIHMILGGSNPPVLHTVDEFVLVLFNLWWFIVPSTPWLFWITPNFNSWNLFRIPLFFGLQLKHGWTYGARGSNSSTWMDSFP